MPPLQLSAPIEKTFVLEKTDAFYKTDGTTVTVRQATQRQHEERANLFAVLTREYADDSDTAVRFIQRFSLPELMKIECRLTVISTSISDENEKQLFTAGMNQKQFELAWGKLAPLVAREIHAKVLELNPDWKLSGE